MKATFALVLAFLAYLTVGTMDYNDKVSAAEERAERVLKATPAPKQEPAPMWSAKCMRKGMDLLIKQADGKPPVFACVQRKVLTVGV